METHFSTHVADVRNEPVAKGQRAEEGEAQERHAALPNVAAKRGHTAEADTKGARRVLRIGDHLL